MKIRSAAKTHIGLVRENNEDAYLCNDALGLYAVADGMGGCNSGEVASRIAIEQLVKCASLVSPAPTPLCSAFSHIHKQIVSKVVGEHAGMGTTLTALLVREGFPAYIAHVGDSRCYLVRDGVGRQLTQNHTIPDSNILLNCLGSKSGAHIRTDIIRESVLPGDVFVLCSDGLSDPIDARAIATLAACQELESRPQDFPIALADLLIEWALGLGGADNITVVVVAVE